MDNTVISDLTSSVHDVAKDAAKGTKGLLKGIEKSLAKGAKGVEKGLVKTASSAGKTAKTAGKTVTHATKTAGKTVTSATKTAGKTVGSTVSKVSKSLNDSSHRMLDSSTRSIKSNEQPKNGVMEGLMEHRVTAEVKDIDYYRKNNFMIVETDYIIHVKCLKKNQEPEFGFIISKTFSAFRALADDLYSRAEDIMFASQQGIPDKNITQLAKYCHSALEMIEAEQTDYLGKVSYQYVQHTAKQRSQIISYFLEATLSNYPDEKTIENHPFARRVAVIIEDFFMTDHAQETDAEEKEDLFGTLTMTKIPKNYKKIVEIVPNSIKARQSKDKRQDEEDQLAKETGDTLQLDGEPVPVQQLQQRPQKSSLASGGVSFLDEKPILSLALFAGAMQVVRKMGSMNDITFQPDVLFLLGFACFCLGLHAKGLLGMEGGGAGPAAASVPGSVTAKSSLRSRRGSVVGGAPGLIDEPTPVIESPMPMFPEGAPLGSVYNRWSSVPASNFKVRGAKYLSDKKKIESGPCLFENRGVDLFLTELAPVNVGRISSLLKGKLRSKPTFIINFRLPFGVLLFYYEIPERFLPFIKGCYGDGKLNKADLDASMKDFSPPDRCIARFLLGDDHHKNNTLKIFPGIAEGPWVVKATVGGKPAIIGTKLPVNYVYAPAGTGKDGSKQQLYLEADLDISGSSAARSILSVVKSYVTQITIDLGFAVQGNSNDELPEQMLTSTRLHGIDLDAAPLLPPLKDLVAAPERDGDETDDEEES